MFRRFKPSKRQAPDSGEITLLNSDVIFKDSWKSNHYIQFLSMDPATLNFAIRCERRYRSGRIETLLFEKVNFNAEDQKGKPEDRDGRMVGPSDVNLLYVRINEHLKKWLTFFQGSHYIIMERQPPINYKTVRIGQHLLSFALWHCPDAIVLEVNPFLKSIMFGIPKGTKQKELKEICVGIACEHLKEKQDLVSLKIIEKNKKKDDLCDTVVQLEAFLKYKNPLSFLRENQVKINFCS